VRAGFIDGVTRARWAKEKFCVNEDMSAAGDIRRKSKTCAALGETRTLSKCEQIQIMWCRGARPHSVRCVTPFWRTGQAGLFAEWHQKPARLAE
jgi:hypothetical protein